MKVFEKVNEASVEPFIGYPDTSSQNKERIIQPDKWDQTILADLRKKGINIEEKNTNSGYWTGILRNFEDQSLEGPSTIRGGNGGTSMGY